METLLSMFATTLNLFLNGNMFLLQKEKNLLKTASYFYMFQEIVMFWTRWWLLV